MRDVLGKAVYSQQLNLAGSGNNVLQLDGISSGMYFVSVASDRETLTRQLVIR